MALHYIPVYKKNDEPGFCRVGFIRKRTEQLTPIEKELVEFTSSGIANSMSPEELEARRDYFAEALRGNQEENLPSEAD